MLELILDYFSFSRNVFCNFLVKIYIILLTFAHSYLLLITSFF